MNKYKWNIDEVENDVIDLKKMLKSYDGSVYYQALDDLMKIKFLLENLSRYDRPKRAGYVCNIVNGLINKNSVAKDSDDVLLNNQLNNINLLNLDFINNISLYKFKRNVYLFKKKTDEDELILITKEILSNFNINLLDKFNDYVNSNKLNVSEDEYSDDETFVVTLKSLCKSYSNIKKCNGLGCIDDIIYCFCKTLLFESNNNRKTSVFNKTLETFFTLVSSDVLFEKGYKEFYNIRVGLYNSFKYKMDDFKYISYNASSIKYNNETDKYSIPEVSSMFDAEMTNYYKKDVSYDMLMKPIIGVYSYLLALYLYRQYKFNKDKTIKDIDILIKTTGILEDEQILNLLGICDINQLFNEKDHYDLIENSKSDYSYMKKNMRGKHGSEYKS